MGVTFKYAIFCTITLKYIKRVWYKVSTCYASEILLADFIKF